MLIVVGPAVAEDHQLPGHPERPARVQAAARGVEQLDLGSDLRRLEASAAGREALVRVHDPHYLEALARLSNGGGGSIDPDTYVTGRSFEAARQAAGAGLVAIEALRQGEAEVAFVAARPPGHHATPSGGMGFCLLNNVAVAAASLAEAGQRVLIVDWDVHHGNGTQDAFWDDPRVLYASVHQSPLYPGTGQSAETGGQAARGLTVNVPLPPGATGDVVRRALEEVVAPAAERFSPTFVLISAGFDAHRADPLADLALSSGDFADLAVTVRQLATPRAPVAVFLEGGYDLAALTASVRATLGALLEAPPGAEAPTGGGPGHEAVATAKETHRRLAS